MAPKRFRGQQAVLELSGGSMPTDPIGILQDVAVAVPHTVEELRGAGSTKWQDLQKTEIAVEITGTVMAWDLETWDRAVDYDSANSQLDAGADVPTFTVTVTFESADDSTKEIPANDAYFDPPPEIGGSREEWIGMDISMRAKDLGAITNTDASA